MGLMLKVQRNGLLRDQWYGVYTESGKRKVVNLTLGTPHRTVDRKQDRQENQVCPYRRSTGTVAGDGAKGPRL